MSKYRILFHKQSWYSSESMYIKRTVQTPIKNLLPFCTAVAACMWGKIHRQKTIFNNTKNGSYLLDVTTGSHGGHVYATTNKLDGLETDYIYKLDTCTIYVYPLEEDCNWSLIFCYLDKFQIKKYLDFLYSEGMTDPLMSIYESIKTYHKKTHLKLFYDSIEIYRTFTFRKF